MRTFMTSQSVKRYQWVYSNSGIIVFGKKINTSDGIHTYNIEWVDGIHMGRTLREKALIFWAKVKLFLKNK